MNKRQPSTRSSPIVRLAAAPSHAETCVHVSPFAALSRQPTSAASRGKRQARIKTPTSSSLPVALSVETMFRLSAKALLSPRPLPATSADALATCEATPSHNLPERLPTESQAISDIQGGIALNPCEQPLAGPIDAVIELWRRRQAWHRAEKSITLTCKAICRRLAGGDKKEGNAVYASALDGCTHPGAADAQLAMMPLLAARDVIERSRLDVEKRLRQLAGDLPAAEFVNATRGVGMLSFAAIVGEAGDLSAYSNPAKLWKRMGLAVIGGKAQCRRTDAKKALIQGYSPRKRSVMWTIGDCIIKAGGPLRDLYLQRKEYEAPRVATKMHAHRRAQRYIEKRLLRDLWRAWREATAALSTFRTAPPAEVKS